MQSPARSALQRVNLRALQTDARGCAGLCALLLVTACAVGQHAPVAGTPGLERAFFAEYPADLLAAAAAACADPGQNVSLPSRDEVICETLPTPDAAASLILSYDGTIEDLPSFVTGFATIAADGGYIVTAQNYIRVPRRSLPPVEIRLRDAILRDTMQRLLLAAGGTIIAADDAA